MAKAIVELVYEGKENKRVEVEIKDGLNISRVLGAIDRAVEKQFKDDKEWTRWNLIALPD